MLGFGAKSLQHPYPLEISIWKINHIEHTLTKHYSVSDFIKKIMYEDYEESDVWNGEICDIKYMQDRLILLINVTSTPDVKDYSDYVMWVLDDKFQTKNIVRFPTFLRYSPNMEGKLLIEKDKVLIKTDYLGVKYYITILDLKDILNSVQTELNPLLNKNYANNTCIQLHSIKLEYGDYVTVNENSIASLKMGFYPYPYNPYELYLRTLKQEIFKFWHF